MPVLPRVFQQAVPEASRDTTDGFAGYPADVETQPFVKGTDAETPSFVEDTGAATRPFVAIPDALFDDAFCQRYGMPAWIVRLWPEQYGQEEMRLLVSASQPVPQSGVRLNMAVEGWRELRDAVLDFCG